MTAAAKRICTKTENLLREVLEGKDPKGTLSQAIDAEFAPLIEACWKLLGEWPWTSQRTFDAFEEMKKELAKVKGE